MNTLLVYNPRAGRGRSEAMVGYALDRWRAAGWRVDVHRTTQRGDATRAVASAVAAGRHECVVAAGGDGTVHEVVNGLVGSGSQGGIALGVLPLGTGCDFARNLGLFGGVDAAVERMLRGTDRPTDVLQVTCPGPPGAARVCVAANSASVGLGGRVVARADAAPSLKLWLGSKVFLWAAVAEVAKGVRFRARVQLDDRPAVDAELSTIAICNGAYFGGAMHIAPGASLTDGLMDVVVVRAGPRRDLLHALGMVHSGRHVHHPLVRMERARRATITPLDAQQMPVEVDGEDAGCAPVAFEVLPGAIAVRS